MSSERRRIVLPSRGNPALELVGRILEAEELARELTRLGQPSVFEPPKIVPAEIVYKPPAPAKEVEIPRVEIPRFELKTFTLDETDKEVKKRWKLLESKNPGTLKDLTIKSPSTALHVTIESDGKLKLSRSYAELTEISQYSTTIDAFEDDNGCVIHLEDFNWIKSFKLTIRVTETIVFPDVWALWEEKIKI